LEVFLCLAKDAKVFCKADFVWAALLLEYRGIDKSLEFSINNLQQTEIL